jgi:hypothetical protein
MGQRIVRMSGQFFADMFGTGKRSYEVIENPIPADARIVSARVAFPILREQATWKFCSNPRNGLMHLKANASRKLYQS